MVGEWWRRRGGPSLAGALGFAAAAIPIVIVLLLSAQVRWWYWLLAAVAAALAGLVSYGTSRAERKHERDLAEAVQAAKDAKASAEPINQALLAQLTIAEIQRATTANLMVGLAGALKGVLRPDTADRGDSLSYERSLLSALYRVMEPALGVVRVAYLARQEGTGPAFRRREAVGYHDDTDWKIERNTPDAAVAELFGGPPFNGGLLIDDCSKDEYKVVGVDVLKAPEADVRSYCRADVRYGERQFGLLCIDSWGEAQMTDADKQVIEAFGALLGIGFELGEASRSGPGPSPPSSGV